MTDSEQENKSKLDNIPNNHSSKHNKSLNWTNGYESWHLCRIPTPMDGSCLFHAISYSYFEPYITEFLNGKKITRAEIIKSLRYELSQRLAAPNPQTDNKLTFYESLNGGNTKNFSQHVHEFSLKYMQQQLNSNNPIGYGYIEFISNTLNKDIYILDEKRKDIYLSDELNYSITGKRNSIVLYYNNNHYELVGICNSDQPVDTHFSSEHSFIKFLHDKVTNYLALTSNS